MNVQVSVFRAVMQRGKKFSEKLGAHNVNGDSIMPLSGPLHFDPDLENDKAERVSHSIWQQLKGDYVNVALLLFLYLLQGIPLGLTASIPLILQSRKTAYHDQAVFSFAYWPFSLKLLWAPIVDSWYSWSFGRRKSWLIPTQYLLGGFMFCLSHYVTSVLGDESSEAGRPNVQVLTGIFFALNFLAATQDIAVDGWALELLSRKNRGYASTCNAVGQTAGYFIGNVLFLSFESADFCNMFLRSVPKPHGIISLADFVFFWGIIYMVSTTLVALFVHEKPADQSAESQGDEDAGDLTVVDTYLHLWDIIRLKPVAWLVVIQLTAKIGFAAADGITGLKLVEMGVPKDRLAFIAIPLVPLQILLPWFIGRYTAGPRPLKIYLRAFPYRLLFGFIYAGVVWWTPYWKNSAGVFPVSYYVMLVALYCFHQVAVYSIFVAQMSFVAQIADSRVGGTYMTLLNTVTNLGANWPVTLTLWNVDALTWKNCVSQQGAVIGPCTDESICIAAGHTCVTSIDGYYILSVTLPIIGFLWYLTVRRRLDAFHDVKKSAWRVPKR